jgi:acyl-CoA thioesterase-1
MQFVLLRRHRGPAPARLRAGVLTVLVWALGSAPPLADARPGDAPDDAGAAPTILVLGDSISAGYGIQRDAGWVSQLQARLAETAAADWQVVNASISGETTSGGLARLPAALAAHEPEVVVIELGGNDGLRGYPVERIRENLSRMVELAQQTGARVLLVGMQIPPNYGPRYTRAFAAVFQEVAERHDVALVPFLLDEVALLPELMQADGIHPTAEAQAYLLETVWPHLQPLLKTEPGS